MYSLKTDRISQEEQLGSVYFYTYDNDYNYEVYIVSPLRIKTPFKSFLLLLPGETAGMPDIIR